MSEYALAKKNLNEWSVNDLSNHLKEKGLGEYGEVFIKNKIDGHVADEMTEDNLKEIGISMVGDRLKIMKILQTVKLAKTTQNFNEVLWEGKEDEFSCAAQMCVSTCCGLCPSHPDKYKLMRNQLKITTTKKTCCGPIRCELCCPADYDEDNVDLSNVNDVDTKGVAPGCCARVLCCAQVKEHIMIKVTNDATKTLYLSKSLAANKGVADIIRNQVEMMQRMERN